jgi:hypothetical protein
MYCLNYRYPGEYGQGGRVQVNPLSTLEEEEDDYTLHPTSQSLDVLQHRGRKDQADQGLSSVVSASGN